MTQMSLIKKVQQLREYEEEKDGIRASLIRDRIVGDLPGIEVLECFWEGDEQVLEAARVILLGCGAADTSIMIDTINRLQKACYLMERS
mgnify:CR=1 FL=1